MGQFDGWTMQVGGSIATRTAVGTGVLNTTRTLTTAGSSLFEYAIHIEFVDGADASTGDGIGTITIKSADGGLVFTLAEEVTYSSGPLGGLLQKNSITGAASKIVDVPVPKAPTFVGGDPGSVPEPPPAGEPVVFVAAGTDTLSDGTVVEFTGTKQTETVENFEGRLYNAVVETRVRTVVTPEGSTSTSTETTRAYYKYNDGGKGRILGYQENGQDHFIVDPVDGVPGAVDQLAVGQSRSYTATYDDGTVDVFTETITGTSQVVLPSGAHDAFVSVSRLERTNPDGTFVAADITAMINPAKGLLFRHVEGRVQKPDGSVESNTFDEYVE